MTYFAAEKCDTENSKVLNYVRLLVFVPLHVIHEEIAYFHF